MRCVKRVRVEKRARHCWHAAITDVDVEKSRESGVENERRGGTRKCALGAINGQGARNPEFGRTKTKAGNNIRFT
jgi:hypothetical protein